MIVYDVYKLKHRGTVIITQDPDEVPAIGDVLQSGDDSWIVRGIEKCRTGCFTFTENRHQTYQILLQAINGSKDPVPTLMLHKK